MSFVYVVLGSTRYVIFKGSVILKTTISRKGRIDPQLYLIELRAVFLANAKAELRDGKTEEQAEATGRWFAEQRLLGETSRHPESWYVMPQRAKDKILKAISKFNL